jgi:hypothetical protein
MPGIVNTFTLSIDGCGDCCGAPCGSTASLITGDTPATRDTADQAYYDSTPSTTTTETTAGVTSVLETETDLSWTGTATRIEYDAGGLTPGQAYTWTITYLNLSTSEPFTEVMNFIAAETSVPLTADMPMDQGLGVEVQLVGCTITPFTLPAPALPLARNYAANGFIWMGGGAESENGSGYLVTAGWTAGTTPAYNCRLHFTLPSTAGTTYNLQLLESGTWVTIAAGLTAGTVYDHEGFACAPGATLQFRWQCTALSGEPGYGWGDSVIWTAPIGSGGDFLVGILDLASAGARVAGFNGTSLGSASVFGTDADDPVLASVLGAPYPVNTQEAWACNDTNYTEVGTATNLTGVYGPGKAVTFDFNVAYLPPDYASITHELFSFTTESGGDGVWYVQLEGGHFRLYTPYCASGYFDLGPAVLGPVHVSVSYQEGITPENVVVSWRLNHGSTTNQAPYYNPSSLSWSLTHYDRCNIGNHITANGTTVRLSWLMVWQGWDGS